MFDKQLIKAINSGRCFALVGSGPSCEAGYPSWKELAEQTYEVLVAKGFVSDNESYERYIKHKQYPELFRQAERDIGDRQGLVDLINTLLNQTNKGRSTIYELICRWPFACYLTTNFDDEIQSYLTELGVHFTVLRNREVDFYPIRDSVSHIIQKLHSDLDNPEEVILTSADYRRLYIDALGQYYRDRLRQIFQMFDVFIIGHSLSDPDIDYVLKLAQETACPQHPIFMVAADYSKADELEYLEKYNIVLVQYENRDGKHTDLRRMLKSADRFIRSLHNRGGKYRIEVRPKEEVETAVALFLYRKLHGINTEESLSPLILTGLYTSRGEEIKRGELASLPILQIIQDRGPELEEAIDEALNGLLSQGSISEKAGTYFINEGGQLRVQEYQAVRETEKDQAYGQFILSMKHGYDSLTEEELLKCRTMAEEVIVASFANRGLAIANQVFSGQTANPDELTDIFGYIADIASTLDNDDLAIAFMDAMHQFLIEPTPPQKKYLASVSQGYFLFHLLGLDPKCSQLRRDIFQKTLWFCDSSVLLPLAAVGCHNHQYAIELFQILRETDAMLATTQNLLREAWEHLQWAINFVRDNGVEAPEFLRAVLLMGSYKQNLFLDGYIRLSADGGVGSFGEYLELILPQGLERASFNAQITQAGVSVLNVSDMNGFVQEDWQDIEEAKERIRDERERIGTYRSTLQVESEAEVWVLLNNLGRGKYFVEGSMDIERAYFVSQSRVIDQVFQAEAVKTWTPEALFRYVSALPGREMDPDLLQQCMLQEYFYAGVSFIDRDRYIRFFGPSIDASKASFEKEKDKYIDEIEDVYTGQLDEAFQKTPDLEKPFFVAQMGWRVAEGSSKREEHATRRALAAEARTKQLEAEKDRGWKTKEKRSQEQDAARLRNLNNPKHVRKRLNQAKKRRRKK